MRFLSSVFVSCGIALALATSIAPAADAPQSPPQPHAMPIPTWLAGTWTLVRCDNVYPDGHRVALYGDHPQGLWMIDASGHYMMQMVRTGRMPFASGDKSKGTPEEYRAASLDSNAHFGSVSVVGDQMTTHIAQASFPNWNGRGGSTHYSLNGNQLTYLVAKPSSGAAEGAHGEVVWQRLD